MIAASVKVFDQRQYRWLYIIEMRNNDRTRGYLTGYFYDGVERKLLGGYQRNMANQSRQMNFSIWTPPLPKVDQAELPYANDLVNQPGVSDLLDQLLRTQIIPGELETTIVPMSNS